LGLIVLLQASSFAYSEHRQARIKGHEVRPGLRQSPLCGPRRLSAHTGRLTRSRGSVRNGFSFCIREPTLPDQLSDIGVRSVVVGKTPMMPELEGVRRLGIDPNSKNGKRIAEGGFEPFDRDDGLYP
jgi:arylsulfatase A-like enzyme